MVARPGEVAGFPPLFSMDMDTALTQSRCPAHVSTDCKFNCGSIERHKKQKRHLRAISQDWSLEMIALKSDCEAQWRVGDGPGTEGAAEDPKRQACSLNTH